MADTKLSALTALLGSALAATDDFEVTDVSDTTTAPAGAGGSSKRITADELAKALATATFGYATGNEPGSRGTSGSLASTFDRTMFAEANSALLLSGTLQLVRILLPKGLSVSNITFWSGTAALATGSNQWFALFDSSRNKLAVTADDTSTAWAANSSKTLAVTGGPFVTTYAGWHYLGILVVATTAPSMAIGLGSGGLNNFRLAAPIPAGRSTASLTNPASCPSTAASLSTSGSNAIPYAEVS